MEPPAPSAARVSVFQQVKTRLCRGWMIKMAGMTGGMVVFFIGYFWVLRHPQGPVTLMPLTSLDQLIAFRPEALPLYLSLWFYLTLPAVLLIERREMVSYAFATVALSAIGLGIFLLWPTAIPQPNVDWSLHPQFSFLKSADAPGNACPSLHVAFALFSAMWLERLLRQMGAGRFVRRVNWLWCLGIVYSTVAIRQHVALDAVAGAILGLSVALVHLRWLRRSSPAAPVV